MDISANGDQPFYDQDKGSSLVCNGEIYNSDVLRGSTLHEFKSSFDCEVLLPLFYQFGIEKLCKTLDGEFAFVLYDALSKNFMAARDPLGIRPLFIGTTQDGHKIFSSEMKALHALCEDIQVFPPGHFFDGEKLRAYIDFSSVESRKKEEIDEISRNIEKLLTASVLKRLTADVPLGFLLSGGLDSSLVCGSQQNT